MHPYEILRRPVVTEKNTALQALGKYAFEVAEAANKPQIKQAVEMAFDVEVTSVNVVLMRGKTRRIGRGRQLVQTPSWKKAVVTLKPGDSIQFFEGV